MSEPAEGTPLERALGGVEIDPRRRRDAAVLAIVFTALVASLLAARIARDTLFLTVCGADELPRAYLWSALATALSLAVGAQLLRRVRAMLLFPIGVAWLGSMVFGARLALELLPLDRNLAFALYVAVDAGSALTLALFWGLVEAAFPEQNETRLFELADSLGSVVGLGAALWGLGLLFLVRGTDLFIFAAALLWVSALPAVILARGARKAEHRTVHAPSPISGLFASARSPELGLAAAVASLGAFVFALTDWQIKAAIGSLFPGDADSIGRAFGGIAAGAAIVWLVIRAVSPLFRRRLGVTSVLHLASLATAMGEAFLVVGPAVWAALIARAPQEALPSSATSGSLQRPLRLVPRRLRAHWAALVEQVARPLSLALAAGLLLLVELSSMKVAAATLVAAAALAVALRALSREHSRSVALAGRRLLRRTSLLGQAPGRKALRRALRSADTEEVRNALEYATLVSGDFSAEVAPRLTHEDPDVRTRAADYLASVRATGCAPAIREGLADPDPRVRAHMIRAFAQLATDATAEIEALLMDPDPAIVAAAATGVSRSTTPWGASLGRATLDRLATDSDPRAREQAAESMGKVGDRTFTPMLARLLADDDLRVRRASLEAAGRLGDQVLLPRVLGAFAARETARAAETALARFPVPVLEDALRRHAGERVVATGILRSLGRKGTPEALDALVDNLKSTSGANRTAVCRSLARAVHDRRAPLDRGALAAACVVEFGAALRALAAAQAFELEDAPRVGASGLVIPRQSPEDPLERALGLVAWALDEEFERAAERLFLLLVALHPEAIAAPPELANRPQVVDALVELIAAPLARPLRHLFAETPRLAKLRGATGVLAPPTRSTEEWALDLLADEDVWLVTAATYWVGARALASATGPVLSLLRRPQAVVREAALQALEQLLPVDKLPRAVAPLLWDECKPVRERVDRLLERIVDEATLLNASGLIERVFE